MIDHSNDVKSLISIPIWSQTWLSLCKDLTQLQRFMWVIYELQMERVNGPVAEPYV